MKLKIASTLYRTATFDRVAADANKLRLSISSDEPYKRYDWDEGEYWEVLDHSNILDERLKAGMPLLYNHDRDVVLGRSEGYDSDGHKCYVEPQLSAAEDVKSYIDKIQEGTLRDSSIGYEVVGKGKEIGKKDGLPVISYPFRIFEASIVTIPADINVGVGRMRDLEKKTEPKEIEIEPKIILDESLKNEKKDSHKREIRKKDKDKPMATELQDPPAPETVELERKASEKATATERKRVADIQELSRHFAEKGLAGRKIDTSKAAEQYVKDGKSVGEFQSFVMINEFKDVQPLETPESEDLKERGNQKGAPKVEVGGERPYVVEARSLGELFVKSKSYREKNRTEQKCVLEINGLNNFRATFSTASSITGFSGIVQLPEIYEIGVQRPTVADLMAQGTTNLVAVPFMQETSITNAATTVAEAGGKPEATFALTQTSAPVQKIAVTIPVTDEAFEDVPTLESYVNGRLRWMVETTEEAQLVSGDGTPPNLRGILNTSGIQTQAKGADTAIDAIRKAKNLKVRAIGFAEPTGIVIHPTDWDGLQGAKDANNQYFAGGPFTGSYGTVYPQVDRIWGMPAVVTTGITAGTALIGAFRTDAMIFRKKGITIDSTNSHASEFANNIVRLRAEERLALAVFRPKSFCQITGL